MSIPSANEIFPDNEIAQDLAESRSEDYRGTNTPQGVKSKDKKAAKKSVKIYKNISVQAQNYSSAHGGVEFPEMSPDDVMEILDLTIKEDNDNKLLTFLGMLSAYTESSQINLSFNAPSSTGKSYIPTELASLFPRKDVIEQGYVSPTAFFHDRGAYDKETNEITIDLSRKILIFLDQPHNLLLQHLRPFLSHDKKELHLKITDKSQKAGLRTKNIKLIGFPSVVFCTAGLSMDEQESTRFLNLSPEINDLKIREGVRMRIKRETRNDEFNKWIDSHPGRKSLKQRIRAIRYLHVKDVIIQDPTAIEELFLNNTRSLKPRDQRDVGRVMNLIKALTLLNAYSREWTERDVLADKKDIKRAIDIWKRVSESQELNLPPYVYELYRKVIVAMFKEKGGALNRKEIMTKHYEVYKRFLPERQLRVEILPMLDTAGLIMEEPGEDKRTVLITPTKVDYPTPRGTIVSRLEEEKTAENHTKNNGVSEEPPLPSLPTEKKVPQVEHEASDTSSQHSQSSQDDSTAVETNTEEYPGEEIPF